MTLTSLQIRNLAIVILTSYLNLKLKLNFAFFEKGVAGTISQAILSVRNTQYWQQQLMTADVRQDRERRKKVRRYQQITGMSVVTAIGKV